MRSSSYQQVDFTRLGRQWDWIIDTDSHYSLFAVRRALRPGGMYVTLGGNGRAILAASFGGPLGLLTGRHMGLLLWWKPMHTRRRPHQGADRGRERCGR